MTVWLLPLTAILPQTSWDLLILPLYTHNLPLAGGIEPPTKGPHSPPPQAAGQPERFSCTRMSGWWALNAASKRRASCCLVGYWALGAGCGGRCFGGTPCFLNTLPCLYHALSSGAGREKTKPTGMEILGVTKTR